MACVDIVVASIPYLVHINTDDLLSKLPLAVPRVDVLQASQKDSDNNNEPLSELQTTVEVITIINNYVSLSL